MSYIGRERGGVVVFEGGQRPGEGTQVRVEVVTQDGRPARAPGEGLAKLAGAARGLPPDLARRHDHYRRERGC